SACFWSCTGSAVDTRSLPSGPKISSNAETSYGCAALINAAAASCGVLNAFCVCGEDAVGFADACDCKGPAAAHRKKAAKMIRIMAHTVRSNGLLFIAPPGS